MNLFSVFLRCDVSILFHSYSLLQIRVIFPEFALWNESAQQNKKQILQVHAVRSKNCFSSVGGLSPLSGGDSENNTRPPTAVQIGCRKACMQDPEVLGNQYL